MTTRTRIFTSIALTLAISALVTAPARAQDSTLAAVAAPTALTVETQPPATHDSVAPIVAGPTQQAAAVGARHASVKENATAIEPSPLQGQGTGLMILGGAGILVGIVVGGNAGYGISVAGAVVGLYGLYEYLK